MNLFDVYPKYPISIDRAKGADLWDSRGTQYLDFYGGHAVISIGHSHPHYIKRVSEQLQKIGFYSNAIQIPQQEELAQLLGKVSGTSDYQLFLCNSGAEANENAFKLASFHTGRKKIIVFEKGFHGRTSLAVAATDSQKLIAPVNETTFVVRLPMNDIDALERNLNEQVAAVCIEGIQGIAGVYTPNVEFFKAISALSAKNGNLVILDEIQSGYGRSGKFFAHQYAEVHPDLITTAKGMGNGFPIGGVLIAPSISAWSGMLGTTFGGNPLACAASLAVLEILEDEQLMQNASIQGKVLMDALKGMPGVQEVRGKGLMIGVEMLEPVSSLREQLLHKHQIFTGSSTDPKTIRLLPPLNISEDQVAHFLNTFYKVIADE